MAGWDTSMPSGFTDGDTITELHLDPVVNNLLWLRYATVFQGGIRRTTNVNAIATTEIAAMQTPSVTFEAGYLYKIEGAAKLRSTSPNKNCELILHEGAGTGGAVVQSFGTHVLLAGIGHQFPINVFVKVISTVSRPYTLGIRNLDANAGTTDLFTTSWLAILRSGDNALMTDV